MKLSHVTMAAALGVATAGSFPAYSADHATTETSAVAPSHHLTPPSGPDWPKSGIAERELGDSEDVYPENMFVEYVKGQWHVWVIASPVHGKAMALDFFSGEVLKNVKVKNPGEYIDAFVDAHGITHKRVIHPDFDYKDPRPGGALADDVGVIQFNQSQLTLERDPRYAPLFLDVTRRVDKDFRAVNWRKVPLYKKYGEWESFIGTALDLRDGTTLITAGNYIFRVRMADMSPVGDAPHLHVVDASGVEQAIEHAKGKDIKDGNDYLIEQLHLQ